MDIGPINYFGTEEEAQAFLDKFHGVREEFVGRPITPDLLRAIKLSLEGTLRAEYERQNLRVEHVANVGRDPDDETTILYSVRPRVVDAEHFERVVGRRPVGDELGRINCPKAGMVGHALCGWCEEHDKPRIMCGCVHLEPGQSGVVPSPVEVHGADPAKG